MRVIAFSKDSPVLLRRKIRVVIYVLFPALPHPSERAVHSYSNNAVAGPEPDALARGLHSPGEGHVFQDLPGDAGVAADGVVHIAAHHQKLAVCGSNR